MKLAITIPDAETDALDALAYEATRTGLTIEEVIADAIVTKFKGEREGQLLAKAREAAEQDPELVAFRAKKAQEAADALAAVEAAKP